MEIRETQVEGFPLVEVEGDADHLNAPILERALVAATEKNPSVLLLGLSGCPYVDSGGLAVLFAMLKLHPDLRLFGIVAPRPGVRRLMQIVGLTSHPAFKVFDSVEQAVAEAASATAGAAR